MKSHKKCKIQPMSHTNVSLRKSALQTIIFHMYLMYHLSNYYSKIFCGLSYICHFQVPKILGSWHIYKRNLRRKLKKNVFRKVNSALKICLKKQLLVLFKITAMSICPLSYIKRRSLDNSEF